jgi:hypothetical protein
MKLLALLTTFVPIFSYSQITLTSADFADGGDTVRMSTTSETNVDYSSTGANWNWDFSMLVPESQELRDFQDMSNASTLVNVVYGFFASPAYQATFFLPNDDLPLDQVGSFLPVNITDVFQFSKVSADSITSVGFAIAVDGNEVPFKSDTIETRYKFPANFNDAHTSRGYTNMDLNPISNTQWIQYRTRNTVIDGWGSMITPMGTFNTLRMHHTITEIDSISLEVFGQSMWIGVPIPDAHIYEWWTNGEKEAVLRIETSEVGGNEVVTNVEFRDNYNHNLVGIEEQEMNVEVYPNPVINDLHINGVETGANYSIVDMSGSIVIQGVLSNQGTIDVRELASGSYSLILLNNSRLTQTTFVKE